MTKAWMLCALAVTMNLHEAIEQSSSEQQTANSTVVQTLPKKETVSFYNTEWMRLRQRKKYSVAEAEIRLRREVSRR